MGEYERPSFRKEWWEEIREYLEKNPEEGFESDDVKEFIKFCVNRRMQSDEALQEALNIHMSEILEDNPELIDKLENNL